MTDEKAAQPAAPEVLPPVMKTMDIKAIRKAIPHRYPFLLVDKVELLEGGKRVVGTKCVTADEPFFSGHFPEHPVMPGVLIVEAMAQTAAAMVLSRPDFAGKLAYFMGINEAKFRQPVFPGCVLKLHIEALRVGRMGRFRGEAFVEGKLVAEAELTFAVVDAEA